MHKSDRIEAGCTVEDEPYKSLERDAEKSILVGPLRFPPGQLPFSASLKAPVPLTHDAVTVPVMFGHEISSEMPLFLPWRPLCLAQETLVAERLRFFWLRGDVYRDSGFSRTVDHERAPLVHDTSSCV